MMRKPRLGMLGIGWIGRHRMQALLQADAAEIVAIADPSPAMVSAAAALAPGAAVVPDMAGLLARDIDGVVIATPSAMHAAQAIQALEAGAAVFCQKPLGRNQAEVQAVIAAARGKNRLLAVDMCYRFAAGMAAVRNLVRSGRIGRVYAMDLVFHNAYGPDKPWFYDRASSGGGCVMDLGIHLVDLGLWVLDDPVVLDVSARLFAQGVRLPPASQEVEDHAIALLDLAGGVTVRLACSWNLQIGRDADISVTLHGTEGGATFRNVAGSFYDFKAEYFQGTHLTSLTEPPDAWGGRAIIRWTEQVASGTGYDPDASRLVDVAGVLDRIYGFGPLKSSANP